MLKKIAQKWRNYKIASRQNRIIQLWQQKKYSKLMKMFPNIHDYNSFQVNQFSFIYLLINSNDQQALTALLTNLSYKDQILSDDNNPMMVNPIAYAFLDGKNDIVNIIQKFGGSLNKLNKSAQNVLHLAAIYKREEAFKTAVSRNMNFNFPDQLGNTPFHYAARAGSPQMVNIMLAAKAKKIQNKIHQFPIHMAIQSRSQPTFQLLKNDLSDPYPKFHPIHSASISGNVNLLKSVLQIKPASLNFKDYKGLTPLHYSVLQPICYPRLENLQIVKSLLSQPGILINDQDGFGNTPLHLSMINENIQLCQILLNSKANLDIVNQDGLCPADYGITSSNKTLHTLLMKWQNTSQKIDQWAKSKFQ